MSVDRRALLGRVTRRWRAPACAVSGSAVVLLVAAWAQAATPVRVSSPVGERSAVRVAFTADRRADGNSWYLVEVRAPRKESGCEYYESAQVALTRRGQHVTLRLRPYDRHRWCAGRYRGRITYLRRVSCDEPDTDESYCTTPGRVTARFTFDVG